MNKRLKRLENNITELYKLGESYSVDGIRKDKKKEWALRYGLIVDPSTLELLKSLQQKSLRMR